MMRIPSIGEEIMQPSTANEKVAGIVLGIPENSKHFEIRAVTAKNQLLMTSQTNTLPKTNILPLVLSHGSMRLEIHFIWMISAMPRHPEAEKQWLATAGDRLWALGWAERTAITPPSRVKAPSGAGTVTKSFGYMEL
jgi:hypothetical protein